MNKSILIGRLGADPEVHVLPSGDLTANLRLATDESYKNQAGEKVANTEWHRVVMFQKLAEVAQAYASKGRLVCVEGKMRTRKWTDQNNIDRYVTEVVAQRFKFLDSMKQQQSDDQYNEQAPAIPNEDVPF